MKRLITIVAILLMPIGLLCAQKKELYGVRTVVIDPGHGGAKPGAKGQKSYEKDITLAVAKKFGKLIADNYPDVKIIYTRTTDADISLAERAHIANSNKADLFISIHANSHPTAAPSGVETFVMGLSESKANLEVARKENADILLEADYKSNSAYSGFDPDAPESYVMLAMFQNAFIDKSLDLAQAIQNQYKQHLRTINRGVKQAELYVLYKTTCPSVLTEIGFISNPTEEAFMLSTEGQARIAICLFNAFMSFKATQEGTKRIANPVIDIEGYQSPTAASAATPAAPVVEQAVAAPAAPEPQAAPDSAQAATPVAPAADSVVAVATVPVAPPEPTAPAMGLQRPLPAEALPTPVAAPDTTPAAPVATTPAAAPAPLAAPKHTAAATAQQYYTVQFLVAPVLYSSGAAQLGGVTDFAATRKAQSYVYTTGRFATFKQASAYCTEVQRATPFKDAWVFLYKAPTAASAPAAQQTTAAATSQATATPTAQPKQGVVVYRVQFCSANRRMQEGDPDLHGIKDFRFAQQGNIYVYTAGNYTTLQEAKQRCAHIQRTTPFRDAFVVAIYQGERITLERAAQIEKQNSSKQ